MIITDFSKVKLENSLSQDEQQTGKAGLVLVHEVIKQFGLPDIIDANFSKPCSNAGYSAAQKIVPAALSFIGGGSTIDDLEIIRKDPGLLTACGMNRMCGADSFRDLLHHKDTQKGLEKTLDQIAIKAMSEDKKNQTYTCDVDWTFIPSEKESAAYSYKKAKGYGSLLSFIPELAISVAQDFKPGNESPADGIAEQIIAANDLARVAGKRIKAVRSDSAGHSGEVFNTCDRFGINFFISLDKNSVVKEAIQDAYDNGDVWHPVPGNADQEWTEGMYCMKGYAKDHALRILILRWKPAKPELFDIESYRHHVICTNDNEISALDWLKFHNGRMASENYNKELKNGFELSHCPSNSIDANRNYYFIGLIAFNMLSIFKWFYAPPEMRTWSARTFRWQFVSVCGRWLNHARQYIYRIINVAENIYEYYQYIFFKLQRT